MTHVYFIRHAEPNYKNHDDLNRELTEKGLRDRELVTAFFAEKKVDVVLSSPYRRALDTVSPMASRHGLQIQTVPDFRERKTDSVWIEDFDAFARRQWEDFSYKLSDGESLGEVQRRNISALNEVLELYAGKTIVIGSHGTALSTVINYYQPLFGWKEFTRIRPLMPWVVHFVFSGNRCDRIEEFDLFSGSLRRWDLPGTPS